MAELKTPAPLHDKDVSFVHDDLAGSQIRRMPEETTRDTPLRRRLKMCPDENPTASTPAPASQLIENNDSQNSKVPLDTALWNDTTREVYQHLKDRAEKLEAAPINNATSASSSKKDAPKSDAPSEDDTGGNIYETLLGQIRSTLQKLHDRHDKEETTQPSANPTSSRSTTNTNLDNLSSPSIPPTTNEHPPTPCSKTSTRRSSSSTTKRKGSKGKQSGASMKIFAVKGTKAERLQECMKYFPKPPSPMPSPPASPGSGGNC
ncbi:hypothetical protein QR685DRAFT_436513 [Neurospora intermedia]|uniref:Uncharacterized protein n=1 Tax=Neurospora intermedia TaxID=5142 RepID=A0ABR3DN29_NEUIN